MSAFPGLPVRVFTEFSAPACTSDNRYMPDFSGQVVAAFAAGFLAARFVKVVFYRGFMESAFYAWALDRSPHTWRGLPVSWGR